MSLYDDIDIGDRVGQVKLWECMMEVFRIGDHVPEFAVPTYSIAMMEGGYVNVKDDTLESWTEEPQYTPVVNKWGRRFHPTDYKDFAVGEKP